MINSSNNLVKVSDGVFATEAAKSQLLEGQKKFAESKQQEQQVQQQKEQQKLNMFKQHSSMNPPEYPILVTIINSSVLQKV